MMVSVTAFCAAITDVRSSRCFSRFSHEGFSCGTPVIDDPLRIERGRSSQAARWHMATRR